MRTSLLRQSIGSVGCLAAGFMSKGIGAILPFYRPAIRAARSANSAGAVQIVPPCFLERCWETAPRFY
jgi:hypothetical protein